MAFQCQRCGNCCRWSGYVRMGEDEVEAIAGFLQLPLEVFTNEYCRLTGDRSGLSLNEREDGSCIFLEESPRPACRIEPVKPRQCRAFPEQWNFPGWQKECAGGNVLDQTES